MKDKITTWLSICFLILSASLTEWYTENGDKF
jgi:hypothetical protein